MDPLLRLSKSLIIQVAELQKLGSEGSWLWRLALSEVGQALKRRAAVVLTSDLMEIMGRVDR